MLFVRTPRIILSGVSSGVGKSFLTLGIAFELRKRGIGFSVCHLSPSILQSVLYRRISGRYTRCLNDKLLSAGQILEGLYHASLGSDIILIDGQDGLYDGSGAGSFAGSDAEVAALTRTPVLLVADVRGFGTSLAALFKGYEQFAKGFKVLGMLANYVELEDPNYAGEVRDRNYFEAVMQSFGLPALVGGVPHAPFDVPEIINSLSPQHASNLIPRQFLTDLGRLVSEHVDFDRLLKLSSQAGEVLIPDIPPPVNSRKCKIAISDDSSFGLCFQDNFDLLRYYGAELAPFSPIADTDLPGGINAIYLTGCNLESAGSAVGINAVIRKQILSFVQEGGLLFAEGGSSAYLCRDFRWGEAGEQAEGVGLFDVSAVPGEFNSSLCEGVTVEDSIIGPSGQLLKGIITDDWKFSREFPILKALRVTSSGRPTQMEGYSPTPHSFVSKSLWHLGSNSVVARNIVDAAEVG